MIMDAQPVALAKASQTPEGLAMLNICASIAGGMIAATGKPWSLGDADRLLADVYHALFPCHGDGVFMAWKNDRDALTRKRDAMP
jgi:hypothetical protein